MKVVMIIISAENSEYDYSCQNFVEIASSSSWNNTKKFDALSKVEFSSIFSGKTKLIFNVL